jgi:putative endonuclease
MSKGYMYILECADGTYYSGSTKDLEKRLWEHQKMLGANYTKRRLPVKLVYYEEYDRIDESFYREKQVQGWSRRKKQALIESRSEDLPLLSKNYTQFGKPVSSTSSETATNGQSKPVVEPVETTDAQNLKKVSVDE